MSTVYGYTYDYTKTMFMKLLLSHPNEQGGSKVLMNFEEALSLIKQVDMITQGMKKIIYLVGWQYLGHDDKYPDFFDANEFLKRKNDISANESLLWLIKESEKYNTVVSFHINFSDAYENAPSFKDFLKNNALIRKKNGLAQVIQRYNGKACYKTSFKEYWVSGLFKRQVDKLLSLFPIEKQGTIHVDNFQCYKNFSPEISIEEMQSYRDKMINYLREKGVDITSEFTYREDSSLWQKPLFGLPREHNPKEPINTLGKIPASWWLNYLSNDELVKIPPELYCGGILRNGTKNDRRGEYLYGNMHGEDIFQNYYKPNNNWVKEFICEFATIQAPFNYLCQYKRKKIDGKKGEERCLYDDEIFSYQKGQRIIQQGKLIKDGQNLCIPFIFKQNTLIAYSKIGDKRKWNVLKQGFEKAYIYDITKNGNTYIKEVDIINGYIELEIKAEQGLIIELK